jgi:hypothetical protein
LIRELQVVAVSSGISQFHQWLYTYLLYAQISLTPSVQVIRNPAGTLVARVPLLKQTRWRGAQLQVPGYALEALPPRLLALLAVRNYIEASHGRRYAVRSVLLTVIVLIVIAPLVHALGEKLFSKELYRWLFHSVLLAPLEPLWSWREHFAEKMDRETIERVAETHTFIQAMEAAIRLDLQMGVPESQVRDLLVRLNTLRRVLYN